MKISVDFDTTALNSKIQNKVSLVQKRLDAQVLKDSNYYCPMDTGTLIKSGITSTVLGSGKVSWNTPYARDQYYNHPRKRKQTNPNATMKWFESAKAKKLKEWEKLCNECYQNS